MFLSGGITDSRYATTPVNYSLETQLANGETQILFMGRPMMELDIKDNLGGETSINFDGLRPADLGQVVATAQKFDGRDYLEVTFY